MADNKNAVKLWHQAASATEDCLPLEMLEKLAENTSADTKAAEHLNNCAHCQTELSMLKSFEQATPSAEEGAAVAWIAAQLERQQTTPATPQPTQQRRGLWIPAQQSSAARVPFWRTLFRVPYLAGAAAMIAVLALGISLYNSNSGSGGLKPPVIGDSYRGGLKLLSPIGDVAQAPAEFRWEAVPGAASYKLEFTDVIGKSLASASSTQPQLAATPEMTAAMHAGMPVNWRVIAYDASGKAIAESSGGNFKIK